MADENLINMAKMSLADTFLMYMKAHSYHWNVIGSDFSEYHDFFGKLYEELHDSIDDLAEQIRTLNSFAPMSLARMIELSSLKEDTNIPTLESMINNLIQANDSVIETLTKTYELAEQQKEYAYSNFVQDRLTAHAKHGWMLRSIKGKQ